MDTAPTPPPAPTLSPDEAGEILADLNRVLASKAWQCVILPVLEEQRASGLAQALAPGSNTDGHHAGRVVVETVNAIGQSITARQQNLARHARGEIDREAPGDS